jgi:hypothetical protein
MGKDAASPVALMCTNLFSTFLRKKRKQSGAETGADGVEVVFLGKAFAMEDQTGERRPVELRFEQVEVGDHRRAVAQADAEEGAGGEGGLSGAEGGGLLEEDAVAPPDRRGAGEDAVEKRHGLEERVQREECAERVTGDAANVGVNRIPTGEFGPELRDEEIEKGIGTASVGRALDGDGRVVAGAVVAGLLVTGAVADADEEDRGEGGVVGEERRAGFAKERELVVTVEAEENGPGTRGCRCFDVDRVMGVEGVEVECGRGGHEARITDCGEASKLVSLLRWMMERGAFASGHEKSG